MNAEICLWFGTQRATRQVDVTNDAATRTAWTELIAELKLSEKEIQISYGTHVLQVPVIMTAKVMTDLVVNHAVQNELVSDPHATISIEFRAIAKLRAVIHAPKTVEPLSAPSGKQEPALPSLLRVLNEVLGEKGDIHTALQRWSTTQSACDLFELHAFLNAKDDDIIEPQSVIASLKIVYPNRLTELNRLSARDERLLAAFLQFAHILYQCA